MAVVVLTEGPSVILDTVNCDRTPGLFRMQDASWRHWE